MSEEKESPRGFRVTDRRRFSEEGEAKSGEDDDRRAGAGVARQSSAVGRSRPTVRPGAAGRPRRGAQEAHLEAPEEPVSFSTFVLGLSTQALLHLGEIEDPIDRRDRRGSRRPPSTSSTSSASCETRPGTTSSRPRSACSTPSSTTSACKYVELVRGDRRRRHEQRDQPPDVVVTALIGFVVGVGVTPAVRLLARSEAISLFGGERAAARSGSGADRPGRRHAAGLRGARRSSISPAVVNISSTQEVKSRGPFGPGGPGWRRRRRRPGGGGPAAAAAAAAGRGRSVPGVLRPVRALLRTAARGRSRRRASAPGFVIDPKGFILTNNHVVENADEIMVRLSTGKEFKAKVVGRDPKTDIALIEIKGDGKDLPAVKLGDSEHAPGRRVGRRHRQPVRPREHGDRRHRQREGSAHQPGPVRRLHPDRRRHQSGQLGRPAAQPQGRGGRHQHRHLQPRRRQHRHRLRHPDRPGEGDRAAAEGARAASRAAGSAS